MSDDELEQVIDEMILEMSPELRREIILDWMRWYVATAK